MRVVAGQLAGPTPKLILFDLDGTLVRIGQDYHAMREHVVALLRSEGLPKRFKIRHLQYDVERALVWLRRRRSRRAIELTKKRIDAYITREERRGERNAKPIRGAQETLAKLQPQFLLGVISRTNPITLDVCLRRLNQIGFMFRCARGDCKVKPNPASVYRAMRKLSMRRKDVIVVGDHEFDIRMARRARVRSVGVLTGTGTRGELAAAQADLIIASVAELPRVLGVAESRHS